MATYTQELEATYMVKWQNGNCKLCGRVTAPKFTKGMCNACYIRDLHSRRKPEECRKCKKTKICLQAGPTCSACYTKFIASRSISGLFTKAKKAAINKKLPWTISKEQYIILRSKPCFYCGGPLNKTGIGLDRIDNSKSIGYTPENVLPCCWVCNTIRSNNLSVTETKEAVSAVAERKKNAISEIFDNNVDIDRRTLFLFGEINEEKAEQISKGLFFMEEINALAEVTLILSSEGGNWSSAVSIYDRLKTSACPITIKVYGEAASSGAFILQAGDTRILSPNSFLMIHNGDISIEDDHKKAEAAISQGRRENHTMYLVLAEASGQPLNFWKKLCAEDTYLTARESVQLGLADEVLDE
jgi:ATP-dependent Clp protease protease subunit